MDTPILSAGAPGGPTMIAQAGARVAARRGARLRQAAAGVALALMALGCNGGPTGPNAPDDGPLRIHPVLQSDVEAERLDLDAMSITIVEIADGSMLSDTVLSYVGDPETVFGWVLDLETLPARVRVEAEAWSGDTRMFAGTLETEVEDESPSGPTVVHDLDMAFVGPGADAVEIEVTPAEPIVTFGDILRFQVIGRDANGDVVDDIVAFWSSSDPDLAPISSDALLEAPHQRGTVRVEAVTPKGLADETGVGFQPSVASLVVVRGDGASAPVGSSVPLEVRVVGEDGDGVAGVDVTFGPEDGSSVTDAVVESDATGSAETTGVLGPVAGDYTFTASAPGVAAVSMIVTALPGPPGAGSATIIAAPTEVPADNDTQSEITVRLFDAQGNAVTESGGEVLLATTLGDLTAVTDNQDGTYTAFLRSAEPGTATVTGTLNGEPIDDAAAVTFTDTGEPTDPVVASIEVMPATATLTALGDTETFTAVALDENGATIDGAAFTWSVGDETVASIDPATGVATAVDNGSTQVIATADGVSGTATLTVEQAVTTLTLERVCLEPDEVCEPLSSLDDQVQIVAEAFDANGNPVADPGVVWSSGTPTVATIDATGLVTAVGNGTTTILASADDASATVEVTVRQVAHAVTVDPTDFTLSTSDEPSSSGPAGVTAPAPSEQQLTAEAYDANGNLIADASFTWLSLDVSVATVDATGLVSAVATGTTKIHVTSDGITAEAKVTVQ